MSAKPTLNRSILHPDSNKAVAMDSAGNWFSYSQVPTIAEENWTKPGENTLCFRIPVSRAPEWKGNWRESLIVFED